MGVCVNNDSKMWNKHVRNIFSMLKYTIKYGCLMHCTLEYVGEVVLCQGPSMQPTIYSNDILLTEHVSARLGHFDVGDIIISKNPSNPREYICKRIVGLPGDKIYHGFKSSVVPKGHVWLEGDNSSNSNDSRNFGAVPQGLLRSRVLFRLWPLPHKENRI